MVQCCQRYLRLIGHSGKNLNSFVLQSLFLFKFSWDKATGSGHSHPPKKITGDVIFSPILVLTTLFFGTCSPVQNDSTVSYLKDVQPILASKCYSCHGPDGEKRKAGLRLDLQHSLFETLPSGEKALKRNNLKESNLLKRISSTAPDFMMPPPEYSKKLTAEETAILRAWVEEGATWEQHWSFKPLNNVTPPTPLSDNAWPKNPIDNFILATLDKKQLSHGQEADKRSLLRRVTFDLTGLPPSPGEMEAFLNDSSPGAWEKVVDRLLASPRYGERWARHWLDVVHFGETHGYEKDKRRDNAWPYRDYVIDAFNRDLPYNRFVEDQVAGDLLCPDDPRSTVALGFLAAGPWDFVGHAEVREGTKDKKITRSLDRDDIVTTTMGTFTSMTVQCARCHDHKFDPISQKDYYSLQAVFAGIEKADRPYDRDPSIHLERNNLSRTIRQLQKTVESTYHTIEEIQSDRNTHSSDRLLALEKEVKKVCEELDQAKRSHDALPDPRYVYAATSSFKELMNFTQPRGMRPVYLLNRGDVEQPVEESVPGTISVINSLESRFQVVEKEVEEGRRARLALWLTDDQNPLTWRSVVNRVWLYHFGQGLVSTPNDFGKMGATPTHPELLDWLAVEFLRNGQSLKWLHKLIVTSATYRQQSAHHPENALIDGGNQYLWRFNRKQLEAEAVHDAVLFISGKLDTTMGGPGYDLFRFEDDHSPRYLYQEHDPHDPASFRRSIYRFVVRSVPDPFMNTLDCADPSQSVPVRNESVTALQALTALNNPFMIAQSGYFAERLSNSFATLPEQVSNIFTLALQRLPTPGEQIVMEEYVEKYGLEAGCRLVFASNEFMYLD